MQTKGIEYIAIVEMTDTGLTVHGCVSRDLAHSNRRVPHATVLIVPFFKGTKNVVVQTRPENRRICPGMLDFSGGHVGFEPSILGGDDALFECIGRTAIREAREEHMVVVDSRPYVITPDDLHIFTEFGELAADEPTNVEYSTGFALALPADADLLVADERPDGTMQGLEHQQFDLDELLDSFRRDENRFADGATRILNELRNAVSVPSKRLANIIESYK